MTFVKGQSGNPRGRPKGSKDRKTYLEYMEEIAEELALKNNTTKEEVLKTIYKVGYSKAREGNYNFYRDMLDRTHGTAPQKIDVTTDGEQIGSLSAEAIKKAEEILKQKKTRG
jgi:hypothetical protein